MRIAVDPVAHRFNQISFDKPPQSSPLFISVVVFCLKCVPSLAQILEAELLALCKSGIVPSYFIFHLLPWCTKWVKVSPSLSPFSLFYPPENDQDAMFGVCRFTVLRNHTRYV